MKKTLLLLIGLTIISCSSDDEDTRTTDPLIGTWIKSYPYTENGIEYNSVETFIVTSDGTLGDGTYIQTFGDDDGIDDRATVNGIWENSGILDENNPNNNNTYKPADFNLLNQIYSFSGTTNDGSDMDSSFVPLGFTSDFNSFNYLNECDEYDEDEEFAIDYCGVFFIRQ